MSGFKETTWKKWTANKTTSPVAVTDKKSIESISSQQSSSLLRSRKRRTKRDPVDDVGFFQLAAENRGKAIPRPLVDCRENKPAPTGNEEHNNAENRNDFRDRTTSPFNTIAPTNQVCRENTIIVQYGKLEDGKANSTTDSSKSDELWGELPSTEVAASPKSKREKGPKGGTKRPASPKKSRHKTSRPPATPNSEKTQHPTTPPAHHVHQPPQAPPHPDTGPSVSHQPPPESGQPQHPRTSQSFAPVNGLCDLAECPARGPKQKERLCMAAECPVSMKKAVVKEAKRAMKRSSGKKKKNPLTILGAVLMSAFTGNDSTCKLTKDEKKALKRMKAEENADDSGNSSGRTKRKSVGVQCKAPVSKNNDQPYARPTKADKSTSCDIPECPVVKMKSKIKEFMDKGQICDIPRCPVKEPPPPQIEKKVEPPKGCPAKPCTLKTKDEEFLKSLGPSVYEKLPRLKMTCNEAHAGGNEGQSRHHHAQSVMKNKDKAQADKPKDKGVKIVTARVHVPPPTENPFQATITNLRALPDPSESTGRSPDGNHVSADKESECQKLVNRQLLAPGFMSEVEADAIKCRKSRAPNTPKKKKFEIGSEGGSTRKRSSIIHVSEVSVDRKDSLNTTGTPKTNQRIKSYTASLAKKPAEVIAGESLGISIQPYDNVRTLFNHETLLDNENGLETARSNLSHTSTNDSIMTNVTSGQATKDHIVRKLPTPVPGAVKARSKDMEMHPSDPIIAARHRSATVKWMAQDFQASESYSLINESDRKIQKSDFPLDLENKWRVVTVLPVKYPSAYNTTSNHVLEDLFHSRVPKEPPDTKLLPRDSNTIKNSKASLADETNLLLSRFRSANNKTEDIENISTEDPTDKKSQQRAVCDRVNKTNSSSEHLALQNFSGFAFGEKNDAPLLVGQSEFGKISGNDRFQEKFEIFVAEPAGAILPQKGEPESDCERCPSKIKSRAQNVTQILHKLDETRCGFVTAEPSRKIQAIEPTTSVHVHQGERGAKKNRKECILGQGQEQNALQSVKTDERPCKPSRIEKIHFGISFRKPVTTSRVSTARSNRPDNIEASDGTCTQTLATSSVSPKNLNTIGVGSTTIVGLGSQHLLHR